MKFHLFITPTIKSGLLSHLDMNVFGGKVCPRCPITTANRAITFANLFRKKA
jgi:hypothetical protein